MEFEIPSKLDLDKRGQSTLIRAREALEKHEPNKAARLLQRARIQSSKDEMARDLMLAATLSHCNLPGKALQTVMNSLLQYDMDQEQRLYHQVVEGEMLSALGKVKQAVKILEPCPSKAAALGRKDLAVEALIREGMALSLLGNQKAAITQLEQAVGLAQGASETELLTKALAEKSSCLYRIGDLSASLKAAKAAVESSSSDDSFGRALGYRQIGIVNGALFRFFESLEAHRNALRVFNEISHVPGQLTEYLSLAETYLNMGDIGLATHFTGKAQLLAEDGDNPIMLALVSDGLGRLSLATGAVANAIERYENQLEIAEKQESDIFYARASRELGRAQFFAGNLQQGYAHLSFAVQKFSNAGDQLHAAQALMDLSQLVPFLSASEQEALRVLKSGVNQPDETWQKTQPGAQAKTHFVAAYSALAGNDWDASKGAHDDGIEILKHHGCYLDAALALYLYGQTALSRNINLACEILERALKLTDIHGFYDLSKAVLSTMGTIEGRGEEIVVEYSLDKAALRQLGDDSDARSTETHVTQTNIIGDSPRLADVLEEIERFAPTDLPVLILGQSGTGKELVAKRTHELSNRASKPFVPVNCATLPSGIIDAELFGGKKGAYSGLTSDRKGLILEANQGTLFLDEIGDFPIDLQPKLLRFLQEGEVRPLGSDKTHKVDVRIIAATNNDLTTAITEGKFREDLFYRLNVVTLNLPPLAERGHDIILIARHLLAKDPLARQRGIDGLSRAASSALLEHNWPGNIRELVNVIQAAVVRARGNKITTEDLRLRPLVSKSAPSQPIVHAAPVSQSGGEIKSRDEVMCENIKRALETTNGNQSEAAQLLNIHRNTLRNWIKKMKNEE